MPNHVTTHITFEGKQNEINDLLSFVSGENGVFDFDKIIPMPKSLEIEASSRISKVFDYIVEKINYFNFPNSVETSDFEKLNQDEKLELLELAKAVAENIIMYGCPTWYEWRRKFWGTKWNCYDIEQDGNFIMFNTAWNFPEPIILELSKKFPNVRINCCFADEDFGSNTGSGYFENGESCMTYHDNLSDDAYETCNKIFGDIFSIDENGNWVSIYDCEEE